MAKQKVLIEIAREMQEHWDFGSFTSKYTIPVESEFWQKYIEARREFEIMHGQLIRQAKKRWKYSKLMSHNGGKANPGTE